MNQSILDRLESTNMIAWIIKNNIKTERGTPLTFDLHSFMIDPYLDWSPLQGVRKASQCGWSVMTNLKLLYSAKYGIPGYVPAANVIYTLPSDSDVNVFVPSKTNQLIQNNPVIKDYLRDENGNVDVDSIQRKKIGQSMVYFKGTRSKTAAIMLSADLNIHDESDRSEAFIIEEYESRLANSPYRGRWIFSNPDAPNMPADMLFLASDQKHWFIKCDHCGHWQYLDWFKLSEHEYRSGSMHCFVDDVNGHYLCGKCQRIITDENRLRGKWVKKFNDKEVSGYWVTWFMYSWRTAKELVKIEQNKPKKFFMNMVRGLPYVGSDTQVDGQVIVNNIVLDKIEWRPGHVAMGVDNGDEKHYVIGDERGIWEAGKTKSWDDIERLIQKYQATTVIDLNPYPNRPRELAAKYVPASGKLWRVYCSFYIDESKNYELIDWGMGDKRHMVYPVRNLLFDDLIAYISSGNMKFFRAKAYWEEYIEHWETMYRGDFVGQRRASEVSLTVPQKEAQGIWLSTNKRDHYCHATLYYYVALSKIIAGQGRILQGVQEPISQVARELGGIPTVPVIEGVQQPVQLADIELNDIAPTPQMKPTKKYLDLSKLSKAPRKSGATSDTM